MLKRWQILPYVTTVQSLGWRLNTDGLEKSKQVQGPAECSQASQLTCLREHHRSHGGGHRGRGPSPVPDLSSVAQILDPRLDFAWRILGSKRRLSVDAFGFFAKILLERSGREAEIMWINSRLRFESLACLWLCHCIFCTQARRKELAVLCMV